MIILNNLIKMNIASNVAILIIKLENIKFSYFDTRKYEEQFVNIINCIFSIKSLFFLFKKFSKLFLIISFFSFLLSSEIVQSKPKKILSENYEEITSTYLDSKKELEDYIIDSGDTLFIDFYPAKELNGFYAVNEEGEIYLPRLNETNVRGLTTLDLEKLFEERYSEFLISPEIKVKIAIFRGIKVSLSGEIRYPGKYKFPAYKSRSYANFSGVSEIQNKPLSIDTSIDRNYLQNQQLLDNQSFYKKDDLDTNISDLIKKSGGITSKTDLSKIEIIRDIPISKGGGKKKAIINLNEFLDKNDKDNDLRLLDGDQIFIPALDKAYFDQISKSIIRGLSPRFIEVQVYGQVENPGTIKLPLVGTLSDAIDITGPVKPLSGKVILIRYESDGSISKQKIAYSANAPRGSKRNPYVKEGDLITYTNSLFGKTTGLIKEFTAPFVGIYTTKELIEGFGE